MNHEPTCPITDMVPSRRTTRKTSIDISYKLMLENFRTDIVGGVEKGPRLLHQFRTVDMLKNNSILRIDILK